METSPTSAKPTQQVLVRDPKTKKWLHSDLFNEDGRRFTEHGYFNLDPKGSTQHKDYWDEQLRRCEKGYVVGNCKITGHHYEYLNFTQIKAVPSPDASEEEKIKVAQKKPKNPDFWDGDYDYYWCLEIAKNGVLNPQSLASTAKEKDSSLVASSRRRSARLLLTHCHVWAARTAKGIQV